MARVKFIRDEEPNIRSLETNGGAIDGALYVATDTGSMWLGTDKILAGSGNNALLKINGTKVKVFILVVSINNTSMNITSQLTYDEIVSDIKAGYEVFARIRPSEDEVNNNCYVRMNLLNGSNLRSDLVLIKTLYSSSTATKTPLSIPCYLECSFSNQWEIHNDPWTAVGFQTFSNSSFTNTNTNGFYALDIKDKSISTDKLADASVTKAKLGSDIVIPTTKADIGLENVDNTADANKSVKYATSAGSANAASVANSVAWDNVTGAPTIPNVSDYVKHEAINEYTAPDNKLNASLIAGTLGTNQIADGAITKAKIASGVIPKDNTLYIPVAYDGTNATTTTTYDEINTANSTGKNIVAIVTDANNNTYRILVISTKFNDSIYLNGGHEALLADAKQLQGEVFCLSITANPLAVTCTIKKKKEILIDNASLSINENTRKMSVTPATATTLGGVKVGNGLNVADDGTLNAVGTEEWSIVEVVIGATSVTQEQYNTITASWPNVIFKFNYKSGDSNEVYLPSERVFDTQFVFSQVDYTQNLDLMIPQVTTITIHQDLSISENTTNLKAATSTGNYGIMRADNTTLGCDNNGTISVKDGGITSAKLADGAVTKAKLGSDVPITYSSTAEPTASDGKNGDVWIVYEA